MSRFAFHTISHEQHAGEILLARREELGLSLATISHEVRLPVKYLTLVERGEWKKLPGGNYARYFIKTYAQFLGINPDDLKLIMPNQNSDGFKLFDQTDNLKQTTAEIHPYRLAMSLLVVGAMCVYLLAAAWSALIPPRLNIVEPANDTTTSQPVVVVKGSTQAGTQITINGQAVQVTEQGEFSEDVPLRPGLNTVVTTAQKSYGRPVTVTKLIKFSPPETVGSISQKFGDLAAKPLDKIKTP